MRACIIAAFGGFVVISCASASAQPAPQESFYQFDFFAAPTKDTFACERTDWLPLNQIGVELVPETVVVTDEHPLDKRIEEFGIRPDVYSRAIFQDLNPDLLVDLDKARGEIVLLRPKGGASGQPIALQADGEMRAAVKTSYAAIASDIEKLKGDGKTSLRS